MNSQYYKVTAYVGTPHRNAVEVTIPLVGPAGPAGSVGPVGPQGPQGVPGTGLEVLTTQGDLLYQGASTGQRLPIGTTGQVLKVSGGIPAWGAESGAVSSVAGRTGAVTLAVADVADAVATSDPRLSDARTPLSHTHGNLTNAGAVGTTANLPLKTGTNGVIEAGSFSNTAGSFCEGNDARLSDDRDPNLHAASHLPDGADEIFDQSLNEADDVTFNGVTTDVVTCAAFSDATNNTQLQFDDGVHRLVNNLTETVTVSDSDASFAVPIAFAGEDAATNAATTLDNLGGASSGSITTSGLTQATARILGRTTASTGAVEEIQIGSGLSLSAGELSATGGSGVTAVGTTLADILSVSGSDLVADDLAADKLYGWDDSESKAIGFVIGSGLSVSGDTLSATASGGSKTYAVFTAEHNQPPATAFATLDTRNSIAVLDFDAATDESAVFVGIIPEGASLGSGLKVFLHWMASTATSGNCRWGVQFEKSGTDLDSDSFDTATEAHSAANGTSGIETVTEITATAIDSLAAGNRFRLKVFRNADDATNDTMTGDAELIAVEVRSAA
jgi:hypothetical protein